MWEDRDLQEGLDLTGCGVLGGDDQVELFLGEGYEGQAVGAGCGLALPPWLAARPAAIAEATCRWPNGWVS